VTATVPLRERLPHLAELAVKRAWLRNKAFRDGLYKVTLYSGAHLFLLGGYALMAFGAGMVYKPLWPIMGGYFCVKLARIWADDSLSQ
jgi:hypothetical protein